MSRILAIVQQLANISGTLSILEGVATLEDGERIDFVEALADGENDPYYRSEARQQYEHEGEIAIDRDALVSESADGAYVQAWVWVDAPSESCECGRHLDDCASAEGANFCMDRDDYLLYDCPSSYEEYLALSKTGKETTVENQ